MAQLAGVDVSLDGSDPHVADAWTELTNGKLDIGGGGFTLPRLIDIDGSSLSASAGGALSLPGLTSYASQGTFQATGNGVLDLPALASVTQQQGDWSVSAASGGQVNFSGLTRLSGNGAGLFTVSFSGGGAILDGSLTSLDHVGITLDGVYPHLADSWVAFTNGSLTVTGGVYSLPNLKDADGSSLTATDGGSLALPGLTAYAVALRALRGSRFWNRKRARSSGARHVDLSRFLRHQRGERRPTQSLGFDKSRRRRQLASNLGDRRPKYLTRI